MSDERLREIRERVEKATPGPWEAWSFGPIDKNGGEGLWVTHGKFPGTALFEFGAYPSDQDIRNAEFAADAREDVPFLLAEIDRLRAELAAAQRRNGRHRSESLALAVQDAREARTGWMR